jgi:hypothetical protein
MRSKPILALIIKKARRHVSTWSINLGGGTPWGGSTDLHCAQGREYRAPRCSARHTLSLGGRNESPLYRAKSLLAVDVSQEFLFSPKLWDLF